ncbi:lymphocyte antigen 86 [Centroberyx affinis]|uniref:lymphocyte antigen 86 n=1 Tax=Centroberyx affinis TaxID=166261 RepID=UPI003A5B9930
MPGSTGCVLCGVVCVLCVLLGSGAPWPTHTVCSSNSVHATYTSCDLLQDIGLSLSSCLRVDNNINIRLSVLLRHSVDELYLSADVYLVGDFFLHYDEPICLPDFPRFSFCNSHRGELIHLERPLKFKLYELPAVVNQLGVHAVLLNQDGRSVACVNITLNIKT